MTSIFDRTSSAVAEFSGSPAASVAAFAAVGAWVIAGAVSFGFGDAWQLVINTTTTIITFLMVFLIQATQNRNERALQAKLDELIRSIGDASNDLIGIERCSDDEIKAAAPKA